MSVVADFIAWVAVLTFLGTASAAFLLLSYDAARHPIVREDKK